MTLQEARQCGIQSPKRLPGRITYLAKEPFYVRTQKPPVPAFAEGNVESSSAYCHWKSVLDELLTNGMIRLSSRKSSITDYKVTELKRG